MHFLSTEQHKKQKNTDNPLYTYIRHNDKFVIMTIWLSQNLRLRGNNLSQIMQEYCIWYFTETYILDIC